MLEQACTAARAGKTVNKPRLVLLPTEGAEEFGDFAGESVGTNFIGVLDVEASVGLFFVFCGILQKLRKLIANANDSHYY
jgi:hypothetical protein